MQDNKTKVIHRLKIAKGHLQGVIFMISRDEYCFQVSQQIHAVRGALRKINIMILEQYLKNGGDFLQALKVINNKN
jgi:DNA-binding FrmR family transcriptional regulator